MTRAAPVSSHALRTAAANSVVGSSKARPISWRKAVTRMAASFRLRHCRTQARHIVIFVVDQMGAVLVGDAGDRRRTPRDRAVIAPRATSTLRARCRPGRWSRKRSSHPCRSSGTHRPFGMRHHGHYKLEIDHALARAVLAVRRVPLGQGGGLNIGVGSRGSSAPSRREIDVFAPVDVADTASLRTQNIVDSRQAAAPRSNDPTSRREPPGAPARPQHRVCRLRSAKHRWLAWS